MDCLGCHDGGHAFGPFLGDGCAIGGSLGGVVTAIEIRGNSRIDSDDIEKAMTVKIGDELTESAIQQSFAAIDALGWFADLGANTVPYLGGISSSL